MTTTEMSHTIEMQAAEIARLKKLLAQRPTEIAFHAAQSNAAYYRNLFEIADAARKQAQQNAAVR